MYPTLLAGAVSKAIGSSAHGAWAQLYEVQRVCTCAVTVASWSSRSDIRRSMASGSRPAMSSTSKDKCDCNPDGAVVQSRAASRRACHHSHLRDRITSSAAAMLQVQVCTLCTGIPTCKLQSIGFSLQLCWQVFMQTMQFSVLDRKWPFRVPRSNRSIAISDRQATYCNAGVALTVAFSLHLASYH
jgi:hypothetical protein